MEKIAVEGEAGQADYLRQGGRASPRRGVNGNVHDGFIR